jgi:hypothetical protein
MWFQQRLPMPYSAVRRFRALKSSGVASARYDVRSIVRPTSALGRKLPLADGPLTAKSGRSSRGIQLSHRRAALRQAPAAVLSDALENCLKAGRYLAHSFAGKTIGLNWNPSSKMSEVIRGRCCNLARYNSGLLFGASL